MYNRDGLESMNTASVRGIASKVGIKNASSYKKNDLIDLIMQESGEEEWENDTSFDVDEETGKIMEFDAEPSICPAPIATFDQDDAIEDFEIPLDEDVVAEKPVSRSMQKKQKNHKRLNKQNDERVEVSFEHLNAKENNDSASKSSEVPNESDAEPSKETEESADTSPKAVEQQTLDFDGENEKKPEKAEEVQLSPEELAKARREAMAKHRGITEEEPKPKVEEVTVAEKVEINKRDALVIVIAIVAILHSVLAIYDVLYELLWLGSTTIYLWYTVLMIGVLVGGVYVLKHANDSGQLIAVLNLIHNKTINVLSSKKEEGEN